MQQLIWNEVLLFIMIAFIRTFIISDYFSDPDFRGYVAVSCEDMCTICYHPCCWKAYKEQQEMLIGKKSDKVTNSILISLVKREK